MPNKLIIFFATFLITLNCISQSINIYAENEIYGTGYVRSNGTKYSGDMQVSTSTTYGRGWAKFDLSSIPIDATITSVSISFTTFGTTTSSNTNSIVGFTQNPVTQTGSTLYTLIGNSTIYNTSTWINSGFQTKNLNSSANTFIQSNLENSVSFGFVRGSTNLYNIYGYSSSNRPYITVNYVVNTLPDAPSQILTSATSQTTCKGTSISLTAQNSIGTTYWSQDSCNSSNYFAVGVSVVVNPEQTTTYYARNYQNGNFSTNCASITINVLDLPNISGNDTICFGDTTNLVAFGPYDNYSWNPGQVNSSILEVSPPSTTSYELTSYNSSYNCSVLQNLQVVVNSLPTVYAGEDINLCYDFEDFTITTATPQGGVWIGNGVDSSGFFSENIVGTYFLNYEFINAFGCKNSDHLVVNVNGSPSLDFSFSTNTFCLSGTNPIPTLSSNVDGQYSCDCVINPITGEVDLIATGLGNFQVLFTPNGNCGSVISKNINIVEVPKSIFSYTSDFCKDKSISPLFSIDATSGLFTSSPNLNTLDANSGNIDLTAENAGIYTITNTIITDGTCISSEHSVTIEILNLPSISIFTTDSLLCVADTLFLQATGGVNYEWNGNLGSDQDFTDIPTVNTLYVLKGTDINGCINYDSIFIDVNPYPQLITSSDQEICLGDSVQLNVGGANTYIWDNSLSNIPSHIVSPVSTTLYTVIGMDENFCSDTAYINVVVNQIDDPSFSYDKTLYCISDIPPFPVISGTGDGFFTGTLQVDYSTGLIDLQNSGEGIYSVYYITPGFCSRRDTFELEIVNSFNTDFSLDSIVCQNSFLSPVMGINSNSGVFTSSSNGLILNPLTGEINLEASQSGIYTVYHTILESGGCPTSIDSAQIELLPIPIVNFNILGDTSICLNESLTLNVSGAQSYGWNQSLGVGNSKTISPNANTEYIVVGTAINGCQDSDTILVNVIQLPNIDAGENLIVCRNDMIALSGSGGQTYLWNNDIQNDEYFSIQSSGYYAVIGADLNGCVNKDSIFISVNDLPNVFAGNDVFVCRNEVVVLAGSGAVNYSWSNEILNGIPFIPSNSSTYEVLGIDANGCQNTDQVEVNIIELPQIFAGSDFSVCENESISLNASGGIHYLWSNGVQNGQSFIPTSTMMYTVIGEDQNDCQNSDTITVTVNPLPSVNAGNDFSVCENIPIVLEAYGASTYQWDNGVENGVGFIAQSTNIYVVTGTDLNGCVNQDQITIQVYLLPSVFAGSDTSICEGDVYLLNAQGASSYLWNSTFLNQTEVSLLTGDHVFSVVGTDSLGCQNVDELTVSVNTATNSILNISAIGSYLLNGITYSETGTYEQTVLNSNGCDSLITLNLVIEHLGISSNFISNLIISPNPSESGVFYISNIQNTSVSFELYNSIGCLIQKQDLNGDIINLSHVADGVYHLKVYLQGIGTENIKLVKGQ